MPHVETVSRNLDLPMTLAAMPDRRIYGREVIALTDEISQARPDLAEHVAELLDGLRAATPNTSVPSMLPLAEARALDALLNFCRSNGFVLAD